MIELLEAHNFSTSPDEITYLNIFPYKVSVSEKKDLKKCQL